MASAAIVGLMVGALAGYGCSQGSTQRSQPLPIAAEHPAVAGAPTVFAT